jgi:hypothetical protein
VALASKSWRKVPAAWLVVVEGPNEVADRECAIEGEAGKSCEKWDTSTYEHHLPFDHVVDVPSALNACFVDIAILVCPNSVVQLTGKHSVLGQLR